MFKAEQSIDVAVMNACVTRINETSRRSNVSIIRAESSKLRVSRSTL